MPLVELIAKTLGRAPSAKGVEAEYDRLTREFGSELQVLMHADAADLEKVAGERLAQAVMSARVGDVNLDPGFDGVYGKVHVKLRETVASPI